MQESELGKMDIAKTWAQNFSVWWAISVSVFFHKPSTKSHWEHVSHPTASEVTHVDYTSSQVHI